MKNVNVIENMKKKLILEILVKVKRNVDSWPFIVFNFRLFNGTMEAV